jgi:tetratricopeptide (TPR) repeat protein
MAASSRAGLDPEKAIAALEAELAATSPRSNPYHHGAAAYRLGLAYAEAPTGDPADNLRRALDCYALAAKDFDPRLAPVEHARVLNAAGAAQRHRGAGDEAARLFEQAANLMTGRRRDEELASMLNNLGLARAELGRLADAVAAFDRALPLFDVTEAQGRRARVATLHNRGQAHAAAGTGAGLGAALADYRAALAGVEEDEAPYHRALAMHSMGVASTSLAQLLAQQGELEEGRSQLHEALCAFDEALQFFTSAGFPYQHALARYNQGVAFAALGDVDDLRRALACFEDSLAIFDPRLHAGPWRQAYDRLRDVEGRLGPVAAGATRADHFALLVAGVSDEERATLLRQRILRLVALPEPRRAEALGEWGQAVARRGQEAARRIIEVELEVLMEVPNEALEAVLRGHIEASQQLPAEAKEAADRALDEAVGWAINGPQRIFVRDFLYSVGFERP